MNAVLVSYKVKPKHVERNRELAEGFLRELSAAQLANRYAVFTLADDVSFIHLHLFADEAEEKQLTQLPSFSTFEKDLGERCEEPPTVSKPETVGSYGWFDALRHEPADLSRRTIGDRT
jgi:quinol monooxygenase YgiN